eukprot:g41419.t1
MKKEGQAGEERQEASAAAQQQTQPPSEKAQSMEEEVTKELGGVENGVKKLKKKTMPGPHRPTTKWEGAVKTERLAILQQLLVLLATSRPVILARDFNCIVVAVGRSRGADSKPATMYRFLMETVKDGKLHNIFSTPADRAQLRFTNVKQVFFSDHCLLLTDCHLQGDQQAAKVIASWVRSTLGSVLHSNQTCAVLDRKISETLTLLRDIIVYVQDRGVDSRLISLDQEKAFDRISHANMKDVNLRGVTIPGCGGLQVKTSLYMDDVTISGLDSWTDYLKVLGILFGGAGMCAKIWEKHVTKVRQKLGRLPFHFRIDFTLLPWNVPSGWTAPNHLSLVEKFVKKNTFDHNAIRQWSGHSVLEILSEKGRDSVLYVLFPGTHTETNISCTWRTINLVKDAPWSARNLLVFQLKELTVAERFVTMLGDIISEPSDEAMLFYSAWNLYCPVRYGQV